MDDAKSTMREHLSKNGHRDTEVHEVSLATAYKSTTAKKLVKY